MTSDEEEAQAFKKDKNGENMDDGKAKEAALIPCKVDVSQDDRSR